MVNTKKFSDFSAVTLSSNANIMAGYNSFTGTNIQAAKVTTWTTITRPTPPFDGLLGYNTTLKQYEYWNAALPPMGDWVQLPSGSIVDATYILQTPNALLPNAQALSALSTGILKSTTVTGVLSISPGLTSIDSLTSAADQMLYSTGVNTYALTGLTAFARTLLDDASAASMRSTLGLGTAATKNATDNLQSTVVSASGSFTVGHLLVAADTSGTAVDGGVPFGGGTVTSISEGTGITLTPNPITTTGTVSFASIAANSLWVNNTGGAAVPTETPLAALTKVDDTNVTLSLGGTPTTALINAVSLTLGWTGQLSGSRGGTGVNNGASTITIGGNFAMSGAFTFAGTLTGNTAVTFPTSGTLATTSQIPTGAALTKTDDTNVTLTLGGSPATALVNAASLTLGWTGQLALTRGGTNANLTAVNGGIVYSNATALAISAAGSSGQLLQSAGAATPVWTTATFPATAGSTGTILRANGTNWVASTATFADTYTASNLLYSNGANTVTGLATANNGVLVTSNTGVPSILAGPGSAGLTLLSSAAAAPIWSTGKPITRVISQIFTANGTYTPTTGMQYCIVEAIGGGGGGGGTATGVANGGAGGGGGAGGYARSIISAATIGASQTVTIGAAGTAGAAGNNAGGAGGGTSLGTLVVVGGGQPGSGSPNVAAAAITSTGGAGGTATTGDFLEVGGNGGSGTCIAPTTAAVGGSGASSLLGGGGVYAGAATGVTASGYGAGGSGGVCINGSGTAAGGAGSAGIIRITEFVSV